MLKSRGVSFISKYLQETRLNRYQLIKRHPPTFDRFSCYLDTIREEEVHEPWLKIPYAFRLVDALK